MIKLRYIVLVSALMLGSCDSVRQPCLTPLIASFNVLCIHHLTDTSTVAVDTALPAAVFTALTQGGMATVIYPQQSSFTLSLSSDADSCRWLFTTDSFQHPVDTLTFYYKRQLTFLSNACGFTYFYYLDTFKTTRHNIDSAFIHARGVTNDITPTHFEIYIHPDY